MLHDRDLLKACQATTRFPWCMASAPRSHHCIHHLLWAQPSPDTGPRASPALSLRASGWHPPPFPMTHSANRADMHCLGVVASVEQAISLQQHREACLEEAGRNKRSAVSRAPGHVAEAEVICKNTWLPGNERARASSIHSRGLPHSFRPLWPHLGTAGQELLPWGEVLSADNLPRQHSVAQKIVISA